MKTGAITYLISLFILFNTASCGYVFYPERRNQHIGYYNKVDPAVTAADAACLLLMIVPGVVALSVDYTTGALYYPSHRN